MCTVFAYESGKKHLFLHTGCWALWCPEGTACLTRSSHPAPPSPLENHGEPVGPRSQFGAWHTAVLRRSTACHYCNKTASCQVAGNGLCKHCEAKNSQLAWEVLKERQLGRCPEGGDHSAGPTWGPHLPQCCGRGWNCVRDKKGILNTSLLHQTEPSLRPRLKEGTSSTISYQDLD